VAGVTEGPSQMPVLKISMACCSIIGRTLLE
jgi:hypothetical protein